MLEEKEECEGTADMTFKLLSHGFYTQIKGIYFFLYGKREKITLIINMVA